LQTQEDARAKHFVDKERAREARAARSRVLLQTTPAADARRVFGELRDLLGLSCIEWCSVCWAAFKR
jgi:hypothetical protein